jgi:hypothetical protein
MKKTLLLAVIFTAATLFNVSNAFAQQKDKKVIDVKSAKVEKSRGENSNIKQARPTTDVAAPQPEKSRGEDCTIGFDNYTGYYIDVYVDGIYRGTMAPWENERRLYLYSGYKSIYCITAGLEYEWKASGTCDGYYYYKVQM